MAAFVTRTPRPTAITKYRPNGRYGAADCTIIVWSRACETPRVGRTNKSRVREQKGWISESLPRFGQRLLRLDRNQRDLVLLARLEPSLTLGALRCASPCSPQSLHHPQHTPMAPFCGSPTGQIPPVLLIRRRRPTPLVTRPIERISAISSQKLIPLPTATMG